MHLELKVLNRMRLFYRLLALIFGCLVVSCADYDIYEEELLSPDADLVEEGTAELRIGVPETRATLDQNLDLRWQRGDRITLLAFSNSVQLFSKQAVFWATPTNGKKSYFKAKFDAYSDDDQAAMSQAGSATACYAISPSEGVSINGNTASIVIPSVQSGEYCDAPDFMTARSGAITGGLKVCTADPNDSNYINDVNLKFTHHTHAFRVKIPHNNLGRPVKKAYLRFPFNVTGTLTVDYTTGQITSVSNTNNLIIVEFSEPKSAGDEFWVFTNGVENRGNIDIRFQTSDEVWTERRIAKFTKQNWSAGKVSTINTSIPASVGMVTIRYDVSDHSRLGEPVQKLYFQLDDRFYFPDYTKSKQQDKSTVGEYVSFEIFEDVVDSEFLAANHSLTFESEHAIVPNPTPIVLSSSPDSNGVLNYKANAPYLYEETFSNIYATDESQADSSEASWLYEINPQTNLQGWSGSMWKTDSGAKSIEVRSYFGSINCLYASATDVKCGRLDSKPLPLKSGKAVRLSVSYAVGGTEKAGNGDLKCHFGYSTSNEAVSGGGATLNETYQPNYPIAVVDFLTGNEGSPTNCNNKRTDSFMIENTPDVVRLSWLVGIEMKHSDDWWLGGEHVTTVTRRTFYMYLDDIRVSIVQ